MTPEISMHNKSDKITILFIIAIVASILFIIIRAVVGVFRFFGYVNPVERYFTKMKTDAALEKRYPDHDFDVNTEFGFGDYGYYLSISAVDENGIEFSVQWADDEMKDHYHDEWNEFYYGPKIVEYQNSLRDELFPQMPYIDTYEYDTNDTYKFAKGPYEEVFFESVEDAIEGSKCGHFNTDVTFKGIDINTADDDEIEQFAGSIADSLMWLYDRTGYLDISINFFHYRAPDENGTGHKTKDELVASIIKEIEIEKRQNWGQTE